MKLAREFYVRDDVVEISRELLGKVLCTRLHGGLTQVIITETEAYAGVIDKASHAYGGRRTKRTEPMFGCGGKAYVYLCYGIHHLFNVVTNVEGIPHAVLIRAGSPLKGTDIMLARRDKPALDAGLLRGPGSLTKALGITTKLSGASLLGDRLWIEDRGIVIDASNVTAGARIGIGYAEEDVDCPYRFIATLNGNFPETTTIS